MNVTQDLYSGGSKLQVTVLSYNLAEPKSLFFDTSKYCFFLPKVRKYTFTSLLANTESFSFQTCCLDQIVYKNQSLCCNWKVIKKTAPTQQCCGDRAYDYSTHICCGDYRKYTLHPLNGAKDLYCCHDKPYHYSTQICCAERIYSKNEHICCNGKVRFLKKVRATFVLTPLSRSEPP